MDNAIANAVDVAEETGTSETEGLLQVDHLDLRLPCRSYLINYKVSENSDFSLATEFLLRALRIADGMGDNEIGDFFGFTSEEIRLVIDHVANAGFVRRIDGRVYLTQSGHALFKSSDGPSLFEVNAKQGSFEFDLISFAPAEPRRYLTDFQNKLPELPMDAGHDPGQASKSIRQSFSRYFYEFWFQREGTRFDKQALYTVDGVHPELRFSNILPLKLFVRVDDPAHVEINLTDWRTGSEMEDRASVAQCCTRFAASIRNNANELSEEAVRWITSSAPETTSRFVKGTNFDLTSFFRSCSRQIGEFRSDRQTVRIVGHLWIEANRKRIASAIKYSSERKSVRPKALVWIHPSVPYWGMTTRLPEILSVVSEQFAKAEGGETVQSLLISEESPARSFKDCFNATMSINSRDVIRGLEVFLVPRHFAYIGIHSPIGATTAYPIPLGVLSFDLDIVRRVQDLVLRLVDTAYITNSYADWACEDLRTWVAGDLSTAPATAT